MFGRRKLQNEIQELKCRVQELEQILCPFESHQFKFVDCTYVVGLYEVDVLSRYKCQKCGKEVERYSY